MGEQIALDTNTGYTEAEIEGMDTDTLMRVYKETGNEELRWPLVLRYEHLIKSIALQTRAFYSDFAQIEDVISEGILTLLAVIDKFDPDKGVKFETFASKRLRGMIIDLVRKQDWVSRSARRRMKEIDTARETLTGEIGRTPTTAEMVDFMNISEERYRKGLKDAALKKVLPLDEGIHLSRMETDGKVFLYDILPADPDSYPEAILQRRELQSVLEEGIASLRKNEQLVLSLHYERDLQLNEIAQVMDLTPPRISQIHAKAIEKLHRYMEPYLSGSRAEPMNR